MVFTPPRPLQVLPLGVGGAFSSTDDFCAMLLLGGTTSCLVDCPDPLLKLLREHFQRARLDLTERDIDQIVLTHLHGDHSNGLESFLFFRRFTCRDAGPTIHALPETARDLWPRKLAVAMERSWCPELDIDERYDPEDFYTMHVVDQGEPFQIGDLTIEVHRTLHTVPTMGLRVRCGGRCFGYSCDTAFYPDLIEFLSEADLIFHECGEKPIHTTYEELMGLPPALREKIHILHLSDRFDRSRSKLPVVQAGRIYDV